MIKPFIPYAKQSINEEDIEAVSQVLKGSRITRGPKVLEFEEAIAKYCQATYAVAFSTGYAALIAACRAARLNTTDRVFSTPNTFVATVGAAWQCNALPVFVDINRDNGNLDLDCLKGALDGPMSRGRIAIMPVHFSGIPIDMEKLDRCINSPHSIVIEDAAHALGGTYPDGKKIGSCAWSQMTMFSLHPSKNITAGEGGIITTNDQELHHRLRVFRDSGIERDPAFFQEKEKAGLGYYEVQELSCNYHFNEIQAALGLSQLKRLDQFVEKRRKIVNWYRSRLEKFSFPVRMFSTKYDAFSAYHIFVIQIDFLALKTTRLQVMQKMKEEGIGTEVHYIPVYEHPVFKSRVGEIASYFPGMSEYYKQTLTLPLYYDMEESDVDRVCLALANAF